MAGAIPYALPCHTVEIQRSDIKRSRDSDRNDTRISELMGKRFECEGFKGWIHVSGEVGGR